MAPAPLDKEDSSNAMEDAVALNASASHPTSNLVSSDDEVVAVRRIEDVLRDAKLGGDLMWSFFVSAAKSYRFSSILHPFPPMYNDDNGSERQIYALREAVFRVPPFSSTPELATQLAPDCHKLLSWVFQKPKFELRLQEKTECFKHVRDLTGQVMDAPEPTFVFEVVHHGPEESKFQARRGSRKTFYAYHGSRLDNFYSILHNGLNAHMNKVAVFGEGTYLSSELSVSLLYSQAGEGWARSCLGARLACVAVCEMIDDPGVKCQVKDGSASVQKQRAQASRITDAVPEKYYVVQNNDAVRVKYLLVYKDQSSPLVSPGDGRSWSRWVRQHKFPLLMLAYIVLLLAIGLANSRQATRTLVRFLDQFRFS